MPMQARSCPWLDRSGGCGARFVPESLSARTTRTRRRAAAASKLPLFLAAVVVLGIGGLAALKRGARARTSRRLQNRHNPSPPLPARRPSPRLARRARDRGRGSAATGHGATSEAAPPPPEPTTAPAPAPAVAKKGKATSGRLRRRAAPQRNRRSPGSGSGARPPSQRPPGRAQTQRRDCAETRFEPAQRIYRLPSVSCEHFLVGFAARFASLVRAKLKLRWCMRETSQSGLTRFQRFWRCSGRRCSCPRRPGSRRHDTFDGARALQRGRRLLRQEGLREGAGLVLRRTRSSKAVPLESRAERAALGPRS